MSAHVLLETYSVLTRLPAPHRIAPVYDALIAATAVHHSATLLTRDRRARATYDFVHAHYVVLRAVVLRAVVLRARELFALAGGEC
ncbi:PIN domain-containing protein [Nocardioides acrostichi]|uniref:PIN domain-containing protein n=1 Tax=Nocardioides acrostichi TaxID=2784339 RepID=UPI001A9C8A8A|nr:PIN domain-containing protein [Nocardioides acrostichi]